MSTVVLYAFDSMADWEYAHVVAGLSIARRCASARGGREVPDLVVAGAEDHPVRTFGGVRLLPDCAVGDLAPDDIELLVLPGGDGWPVGVGHWIRAATAPHGPHSAVLALADHLLRTDRAVAGICAATRAMAEAGFLDEVPHTSNSPEFLARTEYDGDSRYIDAPAVGSGDVITAAGSAPVSFAREVLRRLELFDEATLGSWFTTFSSSG